MPRIFQCAAASGLLGIFLVLAFGVSEVGALETVARNAYTLDADQVLEDSLFVNAETVSIEGVVDGDVFIFSLNARIYGEIRGNLYVFAKTLDIQGRIDGSVHSFSQTSRFEGAVARNLYAFSQNLHVEKEGRIQRDMFVFADGVTLDGEVARDTVAMTANLDLAGRIGRDLKAQSDRIVMFDQFRLGRDLRARVPRKDRLRLAEGATVGGDTKIGLITRDVESGGGSRYASPSYYLWKFGCLLSAFVTGLILNRIFPRLFSRPMVPKGQAGFAFGLGTLILVGEPVLMVIIAATLIGIPLAAVLLLLYAVAVYVAKILTAAWLGNRMIGGRLGSGGRGRALSLLAGLSLVYLTISLPWIGWLIHVACLGFGLGILTLRLREVRRVARSTPPRLELAGGAA